MKSRFDPSPFPRQISIESRERERERKKEESSGFVSSNKRVSTIEGIWDELNRGNRQFVVGKLVGIKDGKKIIYLNI